MIVRCLTSFVERETPHSPVRRLDLTPGRDYHVIAIEYEDYRLIGDDGRPYLYPASAFTVIDPTPGPGWQRQVDPDGGSCYGPPLFHVPGFFEDFFDSCPKAKSTLVAYLGTIAHCNHTAAMFIHSLVYDRAQRGRDASLTIENPSLEQVEVAVRSLNGHDESGVFLNGPAAAHMAIAGGSANRYLVYATYDNLCFFEFGALSGERVDLLLCGQMGDPYRSQLIGLGDALLAARTFAQHGRLADSLPWVQR